MASVVAVKISKPGRSHFMLHELAYSKRVSVRRGFLQTFDSWDIASPHCAVLVTTKADGDLFELKKVKGLGDDKILPFDLIRPFFHDAMHGLTYLNELGLIHRNLLPVNIPYRCQSDGSVSFMLADFGMMCEQGSHDGKHGDLWWMPPEIRNKQPQQATSDLYIKVLNVFVLDGTFKYPEGEYAEVEDRDFQGSHWREFADCLTYKSWDRPQVTTIKDIVDSPSAGSRKPFKTDEGWTIQKAAARRLAQ